MKLYATISSERATKGQGGKWLKLEIKDSYKLTIASLSIDCPDGRNTTITLDGYDKECVSFSQFPKGERQKGESEKCPICKEEVDFAGRCSCCNKDAWGE
jgi:hypothetical protein